MKKAKKKAPTKQKKIDPKELFEAVKDYVAYKELGNSEEKCLSRYEKVKGLVSEDV